MYSLFMVFCFIILRMKKAFTSLRTYLLALGLVIVAFLVSFSVYWITFYAGLENGEGGWNWHYIMMGIGFLFLLCGWLSREYYIIRWRKAEADYESQLPKEVKDKTWDSMAPLLLAGVLCFIIVGGLEIVQAVLGTNAPVWL